jgi:hypothetical protein
MKIITYVLLMHSLTYVGYVQLNGVYEHFMKQIHVMKFNTLLSQLFVGNSATDIHGKGKVIYATKIIAK